MPRRFGSEIIRDETGEPFEHGRIVGMAGNEERRDFEMDATSTNLPQAVEHWREPRAAETAVKGVIHRFEIDIDRVEPGADDVETDFRQVAVADPDVFETGLS